MLSSPAWLAISAQQGGGSVPVIYHVSGTDTIERARFLVSADAVTGERVVLLQVDHFSTVVVDATGFFRVTLDPLGTHAVGDTFTAHVRVETTRTARTLNVQQNVGLGVPGGMVTVRAVFPWTAGDCSLPSPPFPLGCLRLRS